MSIWWRFAFSSELALTVQCSVVFQNARLFATGNYSSHFGKQLRTAKLRRAHWKSDATNKYSLIAEDFICFTPRANNKRPLMLFKSLNLPRLTLSTINRSVFKFQRKSATNARSVRSICKGKMLIIFFLSFWSYFNEVIFGILTILEANNSAFLFLLLFRARFRHRIIHTIIFNIKFHPCTLILIKNLTFVGLKLRLLSWSHFWI